MTARWTSMLLASVFGVSCAGPFVNVAPTPPVGAMITHKAHGEACGVNLFGVIPIGVNDRAQRAYDEAVEGADATGLTDTKITDRWAWVFVGEKFCTIVHGNGYRVEHAPPAAQ